MTAQQLCDQLAGMYHSKQDGRSQALAKTLIEIGEVLGAFRNQFDENPFTADDLRSFWAYGLNAEPGERAMGAVLARKITLAELLSMSGGLPREISAQGARGVGLELVNHFSKHVHQMPDETDEALRRRVERMRAMAATFYAELDAAWPARED